jgi:putative membrane protein
MPKIKHRKVKNKNWFKFALQLKGSVILSVYKHVIVLGLFGLLISLLYYLKVPVSQPILGSVIPSIVLGLLLVFRTNTAYDRFWEGRRLWGSLVNDSRTLAWQIGVIINDINPEDRAKKLAAMKLIPILLVAIKAHLRSEFDNSELEELMSISQSRAQYLQLQTIKNKPLQITKWIGEYIQQQHQRGDNFLHYSHVAILQSNLKSIMDSIGGCERILRTPLPLAYVIHLKQLVLIYCILLPFQLVKDLGWWTGLFVGLVSFALLGIEEIGIEIENPFGYDENDLPLDTICNTVKQDVEELINSNYAIASSIVSNVDKAYIKEY